MDPRDPPVLRLGDYPDPPIHLVVSHEPRVQEADADASTHLARQAQQRERREYIEANLADAADDLRSTSLTDSVFRARVAEVLPADMPRNDRLDAGAVAVRLHDPIWQTVSRYRAADATYLTLRNFLSAHGVLTVPDSELRFIADRIAGITHQARLRTWTGADPVSDTTWAKAKVNLLSLVEE